MQDDDYWDAPVRDRVETPPVDLQPTSMVVHQQANEQDIAGLAQIAKTMGPRRPTELVRQAEEIGQLLAGAAFYRWTVKSKDGPKIVQGPTIRLIDALVPVWGRLISSCHLVKREGDVVTIRGRVLDLFSLTATERDFEHTLDPAPGKYEQNRWNAMQMNSASSKSIRTTLEHALPEYFIRAAMEAAYAADDKTLLKGKSLSGAVQDAIQHLEGKYKISEAELVAWLEKPVSLWTTFQLADIRELCRQLNAGTLTPDQVRAGMVAEPTPTPTPTPKQTAPSNGDRMSDLGGSPPADPAPPAGVSMPEGGAGEAPADPWLRQTKRMRTTISNHKIRLGVERFNAVRHATGIQVLRDTSPAANWEKLIAALEAIPTEPDTPASEEPVDDAPVDDTEDDAGFAEHERLDLVKRCKGFVDTLQKQPQGVGRVVAAKKAAGITGASKLEELDYETLDRLADQLDSALLKAAADKHDGAS